MSEVFSIQGTDNRRQLIKDVAAQGYYQGQKVSGKDVEYFSTETGFCLLVKSTSHDPWKTYMLRAAACAQLSMGAKLELREFYYALRGMPDLVKHFSTLKPETIYSAVLDSINTLEVLADIGREKFTSGNLSKGFIFDGQSYNFNNADMKVAFTERIARETLSLWDIEQTQNIIIVEKNSAASRLVELNFSKLTNSMIVTVGGNFNRAIWSLVDRFKDKKNIIAMCDGDVYGIDMIRTIEFGTMNSRHLDFKFPPSQNPNIYLAGFFPSIGERLKLANDVEGKRPLSNKYSKRRLEFLERYSLVDPKDIATWRRNLTYELEALSTAYVNPRGEPIGMGIYLLEYMRRQNIPIKPPLPPDDKLKEEFDQEARRELQWEIQEEVERQSPTQSLKERIEELVQQRCNSIINDIYNEYTDEYEEALEDVTAKEIKFHIFKQFEADPSRKTYNLREIAHKLKTQFEVRVNWNAEEIKARIDSSIMTYLEDMVESGDLWNADIEFEPIHNETEVENVYDLALRELGAKQEDVEAVREAIEWRFEAPK